VDVEPKPIVEGKLRRWYGNSLPGWQMGGRVYFVTFKSLRGELVEEARQTVVDVVRRGENRFFQLRIGVVMPDHVHLILAPLPEEGTRYYDLSRIMKGIKGKSASLINKLEGKQGPLWQDESHNRIIRGPREYRSIWEYVHTNPVKAGLVELADDYPFLMLPTEPLT
jgi:REP element-mobilizing transposase RayT